MENSRAVPSLSTAEAETFWTKGQDARSSNPESVDKEPGVLEHLSTEVPDVVIAPAPDHSKLRPFLKLPEHLCCVGIDMPGVGHVHASDCEAMAMREKCPPSLRRLLEGEPPADLTWRERDIPHDHQALFARLLFAARDLAKAQLAPGGCGDCKMQVHLGRLTHTATCKTGRVLRVVDEICHIPDFDHHEGKEAAPGEETGRPGDGIRLAESIRRVCMKCGVLDDNWLAVQRPEAEVWMASLGMNQGVGAGLNGEGHTLYTHLCAQRKGGAQ